MTRRALLAALTGAALDPERLLWRPGAKLISIPRPQLEPWVWNVAELFEEGSYITGYFGQEEHRFGDVIQLHQRPIFEVVAGELRSIAPPPVFYTLTPAGWRRTKDA